MEMQAREEVKRNKKLLMVEVGRKMERKLE